MAVVTLFSQFDFTESQDWSWYVEDYSPTSLVISDGLHTQTFTGKFKFPQEGQVTGTVTGSSYYYDDVLVYTISGMSKSATTLADFVYTLGDTQQTYAYVLSGADTITGSSGDDVLLGYGGNDIIDGGAGADSMIGGAGNDTYIVDNEEDSIVDSAGIDTVKASVDYSLWSMPTLENLTLTGSDDIYGFGNNLKNTILGNSGDNVLYGGAGVDTLKGGEGHDYYVVNLTTKNVLEDKLTEKAGQGFDTVVLEGGALLTVYKTLTLGANLEVLDASDTGDILLNLKGNALNNELYGNDANNKLDGAKGDDYLDGDDGDDTLLGGAGDDDLDGDDGDDTLLGGVGDDYLDGDDGDDTLLGGVGNDYLYGGDGADMLNGGAGVDRMYGDYGDDTYVVDNVEDFVREYEDEGIDQVNVAIAVKNGVYVLGNNFENAALTNTVAFTLVGNELDNVLMGNKAANIIDGGAGADFMLGGAGNDTYMVDDDYDEVEDSSGTDTIISSISYRLANNSGVENLKLTGTEHNSAEGNKLANIITGNSGDNYIDGLAGVDTLIGGAGDDDYIVDLTSRNALQDKVIELAGEGTDTVYLYGGKAGVKATTITLMNNVENLDASDTEFGVNLNLVGNALDNILVGNTGKNIFTGGLGSDTFVFYNLNQLSAESKSWDVITDFQSGTDHLDLSGLGFDFQLIDSSAAFTEAGQLKLSAGVLYGSTDDNGVADFAIQLTGVTSLTMSDFV